MGVRRPPTSLLQNAMQYRREVDGLRAVAVLPVLLFHAGFSTFAGGYVGVDVFFVISGYLITTIIAGEIERNAFSLTRFYERRARRILPPLYFVMTACLIPAWLLLAPSDMKDFSQSLAAVPLFASNALFWSESGYFDGHADLKPLLHTWSLAVEEQYYLLFPLVLIPLARNGKHRIIAGLVVFGAASFSLTEFLVPRDAGAAFFLLPTRIWELALGSLIALTLPARPTPSIPSVLRESLAAVGLGAVVYAVLSFDEKTPFPGIYALVPTIGTALVLVFAARDNLVGRLLSLKPLVAVGLISYSAYLWHQPLYAFARHSVFGEPSRVTFALLLILSLALAALSWRFVERTFRDASRVSSVTVWSLCASMSLFFVGLGIAGHVSDGFASLRTSDEERRVIATAAASPMRGACHTRGPAYLPPASACEYHGASVRWAVFGDSHAVELAYALADRLGPQQGIRHYSFSGCAPAYGSLSSVQGCSAWTKEAVRDVIERDDIRNVVISYRLNAALFGSHERTYPVLPQAVGDEARAAVWNSLKRLVADLVEAKKNVVLVLQAPEVPATPARLILRSQTPSTVFGVSADWWRERSAYVSARLRDLPAAVRIIDPSLILCAASGCAVVRSGKALYFDDNHLSIHGASLIAQEILSGPLP